MLYIKNTTLKPFQLIDRLEKAQNGIISIFSENEILSIEIREGKKKLFLNLFEKPFSSLNDILSLLPRFKNANVNYYLEY